MNGLTYTVEMGVNGCRRTHTYVTDSYALALARADRHHGSNSTGEYWATITEHTAHSSHVVLDLKQTPAQRRRARRIYDYDPM